MRRSGHVGALRRRHRPWRPGAAPGRCSACGPVGRRRSRRALRGVEPAGSRSPRGGGVPQPLSARGAPPTVLTAPTGGHSCARVAAAAPAVPRGALGGSPPCFPPLRGPCAGVKCRSPASVCVSRYGRTYRCCGSSGCPWL